MKPTLEVIIQIRHLCDENPLQVKTYLKIKEIYPEFKVTNNHFAPSVKKDIKTNEKIQLSKEDINNPDNIDNFVTVKVLDYKINELLNKIQKIEGRTPSNMRQYLIALKKKKSVLEEQLSDTLAPQQYLQIINKQLEHDYQLFLYFKQNKNANMQIVKKRLDIMSQEKKELEEYIKAQ